MALGWSSQMLKRAFLAYLVFLLIFVVFGFSLLTFDIDPDAFTVYIFSGHFILGLAFGVVFRKRFLSGLVIAFPLTLLSWLIAFLLFSGSNGINNLVQVFSEDFQNALVAGLVFSSITSAGVLLTSMVFMLFRLVSKRIRK